MLFVVVVAEWLRRWTRNPLGFPRAGASPADNGGFVYRLANLTLLPKIGGLSYLPSIQFHTSFSTLTLDCTKCQHVHCFTCISLMAYVHFFAGIRTFLRFCPLATLGGDAVKFQTYIRNHFFKYMYPTTHESGVNSVACVLGVKL